MAEFVSEYYGWIQAAHIVAVISWMAGLLYLPRLFVYHAQTKTGTSEYKRFCVMERKLLRGIMNPAMIVTIITGFVISSVGYYLMGWFHAKMGLVIILASSHMIMAKYRKDFERGKNKNSEKFYRIFNEIPAVLMVLIVILVVVKPF